LNPFLRLPLFADSQLFFPNQGVDAGDLPPHGALLQGIVNMTYHLLKAQFHVLPVKLVALCLEFVEFLNEFFIE